MNRNLQEQIYAALDGSIAQEQFNELQTELENSAEARRLYLECVELFELLGECGPANMNVTSVTPAPSESEEVRAGRFPLWFGAAAAVLLVCSALAFAVGRRTNSSDQTASLPAVADEVENAEAMVAGHASLRRAWNVQWASDTTAYRAGDLIPTGKLVIEGGVIEMEFFCGASLVVQGPAELDIHSDWELTCHSGMLRATVPPAARGFVVNAAESKIVDLGTEFELNVTADSTRVGVIDGEVEIQKSSIEPERLTTGQEKWLVGSQSLPESVSAIVTTEELEVRQAEQQLRRRQQWQTASNELRGDDRLIAYFPIEDQGEAHSRKVINAAHTGSIGDGFLVGSVSPATGRFGSSSKGLQFDRPGARVRVRLDGTFHAFTFVTWVKINSLQHVYNSLFMADGYENGEPHWQIDDQGRVMFSVMVDDSAEVIHYSAIENAVVRGAGRHRIYFTPSIWDLSKSGRWMQLAAVYDPDAAEVRQYVDGEQVSIERIEPDMLIHQLHIGAAELGNWGQPFRKTPSFAVRNLDGTIDEMAIFDAALSDQQIASLYEAGKP